MTSRTPAAEHPMFQFAFDSLDLAVVDLSVVLRQEALTVVVAVRGTDRRVDVLTSRLVLLESDTAQVVELDEDYRAVHTVVERIVIAGAAHPREVRLVDVLVDRAHPGIVVTCA